MIKNDENGSKNNLSLFMSNHKELVISVSVTVLFGFFLAFGIMQTINFNNAISMYEIEVYNNHQLSEQLEVEKATIAQLEKSIEEKALEVSRSAKYAETLKSQMDLQVTEWRDRYEQASFEDSHVKWVMRLHDMDGSLFVPYDMDRDLVDFLLKHFQAWYSGDVETYSSTVSLELQREVMLGYISSAAENDYHQAKIKFMDGRYDPRGGYINVTVLEQKDIDGETSITVWPTYITNIDGEWFVYDYN